MNKFTADDIREAAETNEHPIPLRVRDMLRAYADSIERTEAGVTEEVVERAFTAYQLAQTDNDSEAMRAALLAVWPSVPTDECVVCDRCKGRRECFNEVHNRMMTCPECLGIGKKYSHTTAQPEVAAQHMRWPFEESPVEFADRLREAMEHFPLLGAIRHVLIEKPPRIVAQPEPASADDISFNPNVSDAERLLADARTGSRAKRWEASADVNTVGRVAQHIAMAVEYIEKQYPDAQQLDRNPIIRNMKHWATLLTAAQTPSTDAEDAARYRFAYYGSDDFSICRADIDGVWVSVHEEDLDAALAAKGGAA